MLPSRGVQSGVERLELRSRTLSPYGILGLVPAEEVQAMAEQFQPIDLDTRPDLLPVVEKVVATGQPRHLQRNGKDVAVLMPAASPRPP